MMPITDQTLRVAIAEIQIDRANRQRREIETADLEASISKLLTLPKPANWTPKRPKNV